MVKKNAFGTVEILLTLLIVSIIFIAIIPLFQSSSSLSTKSSADNTSIQKNIDEQVNQIENIKKQNTKMLENINQDY